MDGNVLVTIVIVTYNFESIIEDCLKSIENQEYDGRNLEVIISDDASTDRTIEVCKKWYEINKNRFNIKILTSLKNEGVTKNINKGVKIAKGEWIKVLAGDDILKKDAIKNFMNYKYLKEAEIIFSKAQTFKEENGIKIMKEIIPNQENEKFYFLSNQEKWDSLLEANNIVAPAVILKKELLKRMNYFDERFKMVEDWPFWIKLLKNGVKFHYYPIVTVYYRKSNFSVSGKNKLGKINKIMHDFKKEYYKYIYTYEVKSKIKKWNKWIELLREDIILRNNNKSNLLSQAIRLLDTRILKKYILKIFLGEKDKNDEKK